MAASKNTAIVPEVKEWQHLTLRKVVVCRMGVKINAYFNEWHRWIFWKFNFIAHSAALKHRTFRKNNFGGNCACSWRTKNTEILLQLPFMDFWRQFNHNFGLSRQWVHFRRSHNMIFTGQWIYETPPSDIFEKIKPQGLSFFTEDLKSRKFSTMGFLAWRFQKKHF